MGNLKPANSLRHGHSANGVMSPTYTSWLGLNKRHKQQERHAHATVCERWRLFDNFLADMGERPAGKTLDRIDGSKGYSPDNCRWATPTEQCRNRSNTLMHDGVPLAELCEERGLPYKTVWARIRNYGMSVEEALNRPVRRRRQQAS